MLKLPRRFDKLIEPVEVKLIIEIRNSVERINHRLKQPKTESKCLSRMQHNDTKRW
jgi:hypothetical protein